MKTSEKKVSFQLQVLNLLKCHLAFSVLPESIAFRRDSLYRLGTSTGVLYQPLHSQPSAEVETIALRMPSMVLTAAVRSRHVV